MLVFLSVEEDELVGGEEVLADDCEFEAEAKRFSSIAAAAAGVAAGVTGSGDLAADIEKGYSSAHIPEWAINSIPYILCPPLHCIHTVDNDRTF